MNPMNSPSVFRTVAMAAAFVWSIANPAAAQTVAVPPAVSVRHGKLTLADLLPLPVPDALRARAAHIKLGDAPLAGDRRLLDREFFARALADAPDLHARISLPPEVDVTRWSRALTGEDVLPAVAKAFLDNNVASAAELAASDITLLSPVSTTEESPEVRVLRMEPHEKEHATLVRVWIPSEPRVPPFWARLDRSPEMSKSTAQNSSAPSPNPRSGVASGLVLASTNRSGTIAAAAPAILVHIGQPVQVIVDSAELRITTSARSLDPGREGDRIRVRVEPAGKILVAKVVANQTVEVDY